MIDGLTAITDKPVLVVDLDGTLLRSDILFETFWSAFGKSWQTPFRAGGALLRGKAEMKRILVQSGSLDVTSLPYDPEIVAYVENWRAKGGHAALVTASDEIIARAVAEHLGIFDEVYGSDGERNLKGKSKASFLNAHYGEAGFAYMGDAHADIPVWSTANRAITVNVSSGLQNKVAMLPAEVEHLTTVSRSLMPYITAIRPHQWMKNILVFLPMLAAHQYTGLTFLQAFMAFVAFSLVASSAYVMNDLLDLAADRAHPRKCKRPFAAGDIPITHGTWMALGMLMLGGVVAVSLGIAFLGVMVFYYIATTVYSLNLKRQTVLDIMTLAGLYTTRIIAGGVATGIPLSVWLLAFSIFFFLSLAAIKRQAELVDSAKRGKLGATGRGYHVEDIPVVSQVATAAGYVSVLVMALYVNSPAVVELYNTPLALWGVCLVLLYWLTRVIMITHRGHMHDDPVVFAAKDRVSQICFLLILGCAAGGAVL